MKDFKTSPKTMQVDKFGDVQFHQLSNSYDEIVNMSARAGDFTTGSLGINQKFTPEFFILIPETTGQIVVELVAADEGISQTISSNQVAENMGKALPYKVRKIVKTGTTAKVNVVW